VSDFSVEKIFNGKKRDKYQIIYEICDLVKDGINKTKIMYRANLSFRQLNEYLNLMLKTNLFEKSTESEKEIYKLTEKGLEFIERYKEINEILKQDVEVVETGSTAPHVNQQTFKHLSKDKLLLKRNRTR